MTKEMVGARLLKMRKYWGMTQAFVSKAVGIHLVVYSRYERGKRWVPLDTAVKLADLFRVSLDYLVCREDRSYLDIAEDGQSR